MRPGCNSSGSAAATSFVEGAPIGDGTGEERPVRLAMETLVVTIVAIAAVKWLHVQQTLDRRWLLVPAVLVVSAMVPGWLGKRDFPRIGLDADSVRRTLIVVGLACGFIVPVMFTCLWWVRQLHLPIPLDPVVNEQPSWLGWLFYQFFYVAVAEEVFFRGDVQSNVMRLCRRMPQRGSVQSFVVVLISAGCFALAHVVVQERGLSLLTFFPGLLMAWMFLRTGSLLAPILFHGLANAAYGLIAAILS